MSIFPKPLRVDRAALRHAPPHLPARPAAERQTLVLRTNCMYDYGLVNYASRHMADGFRTVLGTSGATRFL